MRSKRLEQGRHGGAGREAGVQLKKAGRQAGGQGGRRVSGGLSGLPGGSAPPPPVVLVVLGGGGVAALRRGEQVVDAGSLAVFGR